jgi:subtilase family serine protease
LREHRLKAGRPFASRIAVVAVLALLAVGIAAFGGTTKTSASSSKMTPAVGGSETYKKIEKLDGSAARGSAPQPGRLRQCQLDGTCYGPNQIRNAYGFQQLLDHGITGAGRKIVIIDAYGSNTLQSDFDANNAYWGLPNQTIDVRTPFGVAPTTPDNAFGWKAETTLDVNTAHYVAPGAKIILVVARSNDDADILRATDYVRDHNLGDVVSQSYGEAEQCMDSDLLDQQTDLFADMSDKGITLLASSGDDGAAQPTCDGEGLMKAASTPASDPNVTGVGGTDLVATPPTGTQPTSTSASPSFEVKPGGKYVSESAWNEGVGLSSGGGFSVVFPKPRYQSNAVGGRARGVPDIAYSASLGHSILVIMTCTPAEVDVCGGSGTFVFGFGGTSAGSPQWAGLVALSNQVAGKRLGAINPTLYDVASSSRAGSMFHDVTTGNNDVPADPAVPGTPINGFDARRGWDAVTGLGSPRADNLVEYLADHASGRNTGDDGHDRGRHNGRHGHKGSH